MQDISQIIYHIFTENIFLQLECPFKKVPNK